MNPIGVACGDPTGQASKTMNKCERVRQEYQNLQTLQSEFDLAYQQAIETGNLSRAQGFKTEIEAKLSSLKEKLWPLEETLPRRELQRQYESQKEILIKVGLLETLSTGELGIKAIDSQEYPYPTLEQIQQEMKKNKDLLKTKSGQGFTQLLIVPFGLKLSILIDKYRQVILNHYVDMPDPNDPAKRISDPDKTKLFTAKANPHNPKEQLVPLELDTNQPLWVWEEYQDADTNGALLYHPESLPTAQEEPDVDRRKQLSQGKTKQQLLQQTKQGFSLLLLEDLPNIPRDRKGKTVKNRKQLEANQTSQEYLNTLKTNPIYSQEQGLTPEDQLVYALLHLEQTDQVIDDYQGHGSVSYQLGAYFPISAYVPYGFWDRGDRQAVLGGGGPRIRDVGIGARAAVRVQKFKI